MAIFDISFSNFQEMSEEQAKKIIEKTNKRSKEQSLQEKIEK